MIYGDISLLNHKITEEGGKTMKELEKKMQDEVFDVEVQYCDPDDCLHDCVVSGNNCDANILSIW